MVDIGQDNFALNKPIKFGDKKQARVFYREIEIKEWVLSLNPSDSELEGGKWIQNIQTIQA